MNKFEPCIFDEYKKTGIFRHWCQKVLPLVYDDSLSYYELLCKVVAQLNQMAVNMNTHEDNFGKMQEIFLRLIDYVNDFTDSVEFDQKISDKLDEMAADGTLSALVSAAMQIEHNAIRRKILPMTGTLNELMRDERETNIRVAKKTRTVVNDVTTERRITFRRGSSNFTISMNPQTSPETYGMINFLRGEEVSVSLLYSTTYSDDVPDLTETHMYFDGIEKTYDDIEVNDLFSTIVIYKVQNKTDDTVTKEIVHVIDSASCRIFLRYAEVPAAIPKIAFSGNWTDVFNSGGIQIVKADALNKIIELDQQPTIQANAWHCVDISW